MIKAVMIDSREPKWVQGLFNGVPKMVSELDTGDLWITTATGDLVLVERKTASDLLGSISDKRIFTQLANMRGKTPWAYLVITGVLRPSTDGHVIADDRATGWLWESVQGALLNIQETGVLIIYCPGDSDYEQTVIRLAQRKRDKTKLIEPAAKPQLLTPGEQVLISLPGIGPDRAQSLMNYFDGNLAQALAWLTWRNTVLEVAGIGPGTKQRVRDVLVLGDGEEFVILSPAMVQHYKLAILEENKHGANSNSG